MAFTLRQLETFVWVATLGNFRKTAEQLNTTQPTISTRIAGLEDLLQVKLFERDTGSVRLTSKGQEFLPKGSGVHQGGSTSVHGTALRWPAVAGVPARFGAAPSGKDSDPYKVAN